MDERDFWTLFAETGEPMCWLLSRAEARVSRQKPNGATAPETAPETQPKL